MPLQLAVPSRQTHAHCDAFVAFHLLTTPENGVHSNSVGSECEETGTTGPDSPPFPPSKKVKASSMGEILLPAGDATAKRFCNLAKFCKTLLVLPHSTADPERLFSMIGKADTSQRSNLHASTVCDILRVKINTDLSVTRARNSTRQTCYTRQKLPQCAV